MSTTPPVRRVNIEDVAAAAGVSVATVSRALRGISHVAPSTRERVITAATHLGYQANPHASRLAAGRTNTMAMAVPVFNHWYFSEVVAAAEAVLADAGFDLLVSSISSGEARRRFITQAAHQKRADGVILVDLRVSPEEIDALSQSNVAAVTVGSRHPQFPSVTVDHASATEKAIEHLIGLGHQRIGLISGVPGGPLEFTVPLQRRSAYHETLERAGLAHGPELEGTGNFTVDGGREAMAGLLKGSEGPTAVFAMSDEMAFGAMAAIRDRGLRIPDDIAVVGFDDHELAHVFQLTTVCQHVEVHGAIAARSLLNHHDHGEVVHVSVPTELVVRSSTKTADQGHA